MVEKNYVVVGIGDESSSGSSSSEFLTGTVGTYAGLPTPIADYQHKIFMCQEGSGGFLSKLPFSKVYKYPAGLYTPNEDLTEWVLMPLNVKFSEDATTLISISNWAEFYNYTIDITINDRVLYLGIEYYNLTGAMTSTPPDSDTTNWSLTKSEQFLDQVEITTSGDDEGVKFKNQISVSGEIVAGEDSYPVPIAYHCTIADTTGTTIVNAIDRSSIFQSDSGSYAGLFNGTTSGKYILVGSDIPFEGTKLKYESLATVEPANIVVEYIETSASGWKESTFMGTNAEGDFEAHGWNIAVHNHTSEHIFMGFNPLTRDSTYTWEATTLNINGVDITKYWARLRITSDITGDPQVQQIKLHTDRIEIESMGIFRYGRSRKKTTILAGIHNLITNALEDPSNRDIKYTDTFTAKTINNRLQANRDDGVAITVNRISGLDTSIALSINISYYVDGTGTGDLELFIRGSQIEDGNVYDGNATTDDYVVYDTITLDSDETRRTVQATVPINKLDSTSAEFIEISRLGASSANDTLASDIVLVSVEVIGYLWKM